MEGILDTLNSPLGQTIINGIANATGQETNKTSSVLTMAFPVLMKAMERNSQNPEAAKGLLGALNKHDGGILENLTEMFNGGVNEEIVNDGSKIINHILGSKQQGVQQIIGQKTGMDANMVGNILKTAAPILMGMLGKQSKQGGISSSNNLGELISGMLGNNSGQNEQNFLEKILDADGDGSVIDDVAGMVLGASQKKSGGLLGGLLGGIFGKK